ncbi:MAG TPA: M48 family metalloprotease [Candidatus Binatia bacterium]|nr:M48 family metalloprotease [Candidatus Binatia bacterium]
MRAARLPALLLLGLVAAACATPRHAPGALPDLRPGERPALDTDEAGLWMQMDRLEEALRTSGTLLGDASVERYLGGVLCRLAPDYCGSVRLYVVQTPHFNATMAPNGVLQVWTGLLLRAENEAQLAYVLGHELGHYLRRHSLQMWRDVRLKTNVVAFFSVLAAAAGQGYAGPLAQLVALGSVLAFSRDNEREADEVGFELMARAGYDPREAPRIWEALEREREAAGRSAPLIFFATHPPTAERIATLREQAERAYAPEQVWRVGRAEWVAATARIRPVLLRDELRLRDFARTAVLLDRLLAAEPRSGLLRFYQGEMFRLRAGEGDEGRALAAYERALAADDPPVEIHRSVGLLRLRRGERVQARAAFERYLAAVPAAEDRAMIESYLERLR